MSKPNRYIASLVDAGLKRSLKENGYKKQSFTFRQFNTDHIKVVNVQGSPWNSRDETKFTINLGVYFPGAIKFHDRVTVKEKPYEYDCLVHQRIGFLMPVKRDFWWSIVDKTDIAKLSNETIDVWRKYGQPWLKRYSDLNNARDFFMENGYNFPFLAAVFSLALSDKFKAAEYLKLAILQSSEDSKRFTEFAKKHNIVL
jgi:hypothetical protein